MSKVAVIFKVYPKDGEFDKAMEGLKKMKSNGMQTEEIGFGIKLIKIMFVYEDTETSSSKIEEDVRKCDGVGEVEVAEETLV